MYNVRFVACVLSLVALTFSNVLSAQPIGLHPENPHYFLFRGQPAVLVTSGEHYGAVLNLDFDYETYLETLEEDGLNLTRLFTGVYVESWGEGWNTLNPAPGRYLAPWARSDTPGYADGGNKFDLDTWDEAYFERLRNFAAEAGQRNIVVEVVLFCVYYHDDQWNLSPLNARNNINGIGTGERHEVFNENDAAMMAVQDRMVRKIVSELKDFDNVYFELCNEPYWDEGPALGDPWNDRIIQAIRDETNEHLIALNIANDSARVEQINPEVGILNFHYAQPPNAVTMNYDHPRVIADDETGFDGPEDTPYRIEGWDFLLAGGGAYSNLDWSFTVDAENGTSTEAEDRLGGGSPTLRKQLGYLKRFMDEIPFIRMKPDNDLIRGGLPDTATARTLAAPGEVYAIYIKGGEQVDLAVALPPGRYEADWLNPRTGEIDKKEQVQSEGGTTILSSPGYEKDIALRIVVQ